MDANVTYKTAKSSFRGSTESRRETGSPIGRSTSSVLSERRMVYFPGVGLPLDGSTLHKRQSVDRHTGEPNAGAHESKKASGAPAATMLYV